ncbi:hypothetical protein [Gilvibacter sediminis]|uniref:hypothetical protein n=1 Tax=Gilvibacter sediminis TaxID=379071 RepID=UPI00234FEB94|nr:hypothetical protein [Gilvibacter sediminis]MDC7997989.1 hypothetical protein [Gilvibacter sediminis]
MILIGPKLYLEEEHIINLKRIYESENQSLHKAEFVDEAGNPHSDYERVLLELVAMDYIESENDEDIFFLTSFGYDCVEQLNGKKKG